MANKPVWRIVCGLAVIGFVLLIFAAIAVYSQTDRFRELLRGQLVRALSARYPGAFERRDEQISIEYRLSPTWEGPRPDRPETAAPTSSGASSIEKKF